MSSMECVIQATAPKDTTVDCMICGASIQFTEGNGGSLNCNDCGSAYEVLSEEPLSLHYPGQDCGE